MKRECKYSIVVNADDFGLSKVHTDAIVESIKNEYIDSTSIMTNTNDFERACMLAKKNEFIENVGLHLNLSEGYPLTDDIRKDLLFCDPITGQFNRFFQKKIISRIVLPKKSRENLIKEINEQIKKYRDIGLLPTFLDSHHHVHKDLSILMILLPLMKKHQIKKIRIAKNTGRSIKNNLNKIVNFIITLYPGIEKKTDYLFQSIAETENVKFKKNVEVEVHPYKENGVLIDKTKDVYLSRYMSDVIKLKKKGNMNENLFYIKQLSNKK